MFAFINLKRRIVAVKSNRILGCRNIAMINFNVDSVGSGEDVLQVQSAAGVVHV